MRHEAWTWGWGRRDGVDTFSPDDAAAVAGWTEVGDQGFLRVVDDVMDPDVNRRVQGMAEAVRAAQIPGVVGIVPAYASLLVEWEGAAKDRRAALLRVARAAERPRGGFPSRVFRVPVLYGGDAGPDLEEAAERLGLAAAHVVTLHAENAYRIFCLGFAPGFPLAGPLDARLVLPRRPSPRARVPEGSVAMAGAQTGIYPTATPGGWHLIGRTPLRLFGAQRTPPVAWGPGDVIQFIPIEQEEYHRLRALPPDHPRSMPSPEAVDAPS